MSALKYLAKDPSPIQGLWFWFIFIFQRLRHNQYWLFDFWKWGGGGGKATKSMTYTKEIEGQFFYPMIPVTKEKLLRRISYSEMLSAFFVSFHSFSAEIKESHLAFVLNRARLKKKCDCHWCFSLRACVLPMLSDILQMLGTQRSSLLISFLQFFEILCKI